MLTIRIFISGLQTIRMENGIMTFKRFLVPYDKMPEIVSPDKIVGVMDENVSKFCGIDKGTVVVAEWEILWHQ